MRPALALVSLKRLADHRQLARLLGILGAALELIGAQHQQDMHGIRLSRGRRRHPCRRDPFVAEHVAHGLQGADGRNALLVDVAHAARYCAASAASSRSWPKIATTNVRRDWSGAARETHRWKIFDPL